jgi:hypothetical protein
LRKINGPLRPPVHEGGQRLQVTVFGVVQDVSVTAIDGLESFDGVCGRLAIDGAEGRACVNLGNKANALGRLERKARSKW